MDNKVEKSIAWYQKCHPLYARLAKKVEDIIRDVLEAKEITYSTVTSRPKNMDSFREKASKDKYTDPRMEIMDLAGIRVITYFDSDVHKICNLIEQLFDIITEHSIDKTGLLGSNKVGYRSIHYVAELPGNRTSLMEFQMFKNMRFEIQVRTILQHAWAEIEHNRNYKFSGVLPIHVRRRFALVAGMLEMADREFDSIAAEIDQYADIVSKETIQGKLDRLIDTISLREFMLMKFEDAVANGLAPFFGAKDSGAVEIVQELQDCGISTLAKLDLIIPDDLQEKIPEELTTGTFLGLLRTIMIISDHNRYFSKAWKNHWVGMDKYTFAAMNAYHIPVEEYEELLGAATTNDDVIDYDITEE